MSGIRGATSCVEFCGLVSNEVIVELLSTKGFVDCGLSALEPSKLKVGDGNAPADAGEAARLRKGLLEARSIVRWEEDFGSITHSWSRQCCEFKKRQLII